MSVAVIFKLKAVNGSNVRTAMVKSPSGGWQPRLAVTVEEEDGSSNVDYVSTVALVAARVWLQKEEDGAAIYTAIAKEGSNGME
ncbi:hypothetical protein B296_00034978 [Ensete ventricosum]|uniref:Uncharacterized protein n=1 Tax=Ensete ventricosum TaxID=4639 RepID=A0A426XGB0_ENSVE|nr:hypothetical protein B296_00034978 [Ensete ventricosum]